MEYLKKYLKNPIIYIGIVCFLLLSNIFSVLYFLIIRKEEKIVCEPCPEVILEPLEKVEEEIIIPTFKVDIKGYVKNPGVYEVKEGTIINELISMAGGVKNGGTTENINLSKKLYAEDMIVVLSKTELKKVNSTNTTTSSNVTKNPSEIQDIGQKKISLNKATKEELMTLSGIGEAKALSIIAYRTEKPFTDISEIINISGIGESIYEKIKDNITI